MIVSVLAMLLAGWIGLQADAYVCPMHPEILSVRVGVCPKCGMALLRRSSDPAAPEYLMDVTPRWNPSGKAAELALRFRTPDGREPGAFQIVHEKELHLFVVSRDLQHFAHVHPTRRRAGEYSIRFDFPTPGDYMVFADFVPSGAAPQTLQRLIVTPGYSTGDLPKLVDSGLGDRVVGGLRFSVNAEEFRAATPTLLTFTVVDDASGQPVRDLEQYLGAVGHLFFADEDFSDASHSHPLENGQGPSIRFLTRFNTDGPHRFWLQVQRGGRVHTIGWTVNVPPPR